MSGEEHAALWHQDALSAAPEWSEIRNLARDASDMLEEVDVLLVETAVGPAEVYAPLAREAVDGGP